MKGKTEKILCGFSSIFPKYLGKYARKMRARRYETGSEGKFARRWRAKSPDALCAVLPLLFLLVLSGHCSPACALLPHLRTHNNHSTFPYDVCHTMNSNFLSFSFPQKSVPSTARGETGYANFLLKYPPDFVRRCLSLPPACSSCGIRSARRHLLPDSPAASSSS